MPQLISAGKTLERALDPIRITLNKLKGTPDGDKLNLVYQLLQAMCRKHTDVVPLARPHVPRKRQKLDLNTQFALSQGSVPPPKGYYSQDPEIAPAVSQSIDPPLPPAPLLSQPLTAAVKEPEYVIIDGSKYVTHDDSGNLLPPLESYDDTIRDEMGYTERDVEKLKREIEN